MTKTKLLPAENFTIQLFEAIEKNSLINTGHSEEHLAAEIYDLAFEKFRIANHWQNLVKSNSFFLLRLFK